MTTRMSFLSGIYLLVASEDAQPGVALPAAAPDARCERRQGQRLEVADARDQRERRHDERRDGDERSRPAACPAATERAADDLRRADRSREPAERAAERL